MLIPMTLSIALAAQVLLGGSTGADGAFTPTVNTVLNVPDGGVFNYTTINIPYNITVSFNRNIRNDPVMFLATASVVINGTIDISGETALLNRGGRGGPGGYDGGDPGFGAPAGAGHGPGGGVHSAVEGYNRSAAAHSNIPIAAAEAHPYGSKLCMPLVGGSGGAGNADLMGGGGGGGAILIASETSIAIGGSVQARGGQYSYSGTSTTEYSGSGSGGCIRVVAPKVVLTGSLDASYSSHGAYGYVRIDAIDKVGVGGNKYPSVAPGFSMGTNMVVKLTTMPTVALISAAGIPTNGQPFFHTLLPGAAASQPVEFTTSNFPACASVTLRVVPASGVAVETVVEGLTNGLHTRNVTIPANTATAVEVYGRVASCPAQ